MFSNSICQLLFTLPPLILAPCHRWGELPYPGAGEDELVIGFTKGGGCVQSVCMSV